MICGDCGLERTTTIHTFFCGCRARLCCIRALLRVRETSCPRCVDPVSVIHPLPLYSAI